MLLLKFSASCPPAHPEAGVCGAGVLGCWQRCSRACCCQREIESGLAGPDPYPGSPSMPSGCHACPWGHGLLASLPAWQRLVRGARGCRRGVELPTAGSWLGWARTPCHTSGGEESTHPPFGDPQIPLVRPAEGYHSPLRRYKPFLL